MPAHPVSMAHTYSLLYGMPTTGLRFFIVYGPWERPDMALQVITQIRAPARNLGGSTTSGTIGR